MSSFGSLRRWMNSGSVTALVAGGICFALAFATGWWPTSMLVLLVGALTVLTAASGRPLPRVELSLARWMLTPAVILIGLLAVFAYPDEYPHQSCREYSTPVWREAERPPDALPDCAVVFRERMENRSDRINHSQGLVMLGLSSLVASFVLGTRPARIPDTADSWTGVVLLVLNCLFLVGAAGVLHPDFGAH